MEMYIIACIFDFLQELVNSGAIKFTLTSVDQDHHESKKDRCPYESTNSANEDLGWRVIVQKMSASAVPSPTPDKKSVGGFKQPRGDVPKTQEPFSRSKLTRSIREPSLIQKAETAIRDRCCLLEGEESYECWEAFFEFQDMKECKAQAGSVSSSPLERVENLVRQSEGVKSLIENVHMIAKASKMHHNSKNNSNKRPQTEPPLKEEGRRPFPEPDGLPKTLEEVEEEEKAMMPESSYTRLLRTKGCFPAWYSPHPDHETD